MGASAISMLRSRSWFPSNWTKKPQPSCGNSTIVRSSPIRAPTWHGESLNAITALHLLAQAQPLIKRLDDQTRAKVLSALAGLIILGFAMVLLAWLGARVVQRY